MHRNSGITSSNGGAASRRPLVDRLRMTLQAARGNAEIRECLRRLVDDAERLDLIVAELGPRHALVLDLLAIARHTGYEADSRAAAEAR